MPGSSLTGRGVLVAFAAVCACAPPPVSSAPVAPLPSPSAAATATSPPPAVSAPSTTSTSPAPPASTATGAAPVPPPAPSGGPRRASAADAAHLVLFAANGRHGFRDARGAVVLPPTFLVAYPFDAHGVARVRDDTGWRCIDARGATLLRPYVFDNGPDYPSEGLARFVDDGGGGGSGGKIGYADAACAVVIPATYDFGAPFEDGLAAVCTGCRTVADGEHARVLGGSWGFIDTRGQVIVPLRFEAVERFENGRAGVILGGKRQIIDRRGQIVK